MLRNSCLRSAAAFGQLCDRLQLRAAVATAWARDRCAHHRREPGGARITHFPAVLLVAVLWFPCHPAACMLPCLAYCMSSTRIPDPHNPDSSRVALPPGHAISQRQARKRSSARPSATCALHGIRTSLGLHAERRFPSQLGFQPTSGGIQELTFRSNQNVWGYFSVGTSGSLHE